MNKKESGVKIKREESSFPLTMTDFNKLLDGLRKDKKYQWELYARISFVTALRSGDVLTLKWKDILNKKTLVFVERKRRKERNIKFSDSVSEKISELYELMGSPDVELPIMANINIYNRIGEIKVMTQQNINKQLKNFKFIYGLDIPVRRFQTHTFRKTFGKYIYESNGKSYNTLVMLNLIYNHSSIKQTQTYIGITDEEITNLYETIKF